MRVLEPFQTYIVAVAFMSLTKPIYYCTFNTLQDAAAYAKKRAVEFDVEDVCIYEKTSR